MHAFGARGSIGRENKMADPADDRVYPKYDYDEYPKTLPSDDFWGQVRRTVNGKAIGTEQIKMIVDAVRDGLAFHSSDGLLDIACGNGALSKELFGDISYFRGIDSSEYLIKVAKTHFADPPNFEFDKIDVRSFISSKSQYPRLNKALCYGSFSYFSEDDGEHLLGQLSTCCPNIEVLYIGNNPDLDRAHLFYQNDSVERSLLKTHRSQIGRWRSRPEFIDLAFRTGWTCEVRLMPKEFYASHYRFDAILRRIHGTL